MHTLCKSQWKLPEIKDKLINTGKLKYIYKDFPLDLPAMLAAMVTHCYKGAQYHAVLGSLYKNQKNGLSKQITRKN